MSRRSGKRDVATVAVAHQHCAPTFQQTDQVIELSGHVERAEMVERMSVAPTVVAQDSELLVQSSAEFQHARRPVHRAMYQNDQRVGYIASFG